MKKRLLTFALILITVFMATGCYVTKAERISRIVGTYKLTNYTDDGVNMIEKLGLEVYLVINNEGKSYYVYKRGEFERTVEEIDVRFIPDEEETNKYAYVEFKRGNSATWEKYGYFSKSLNRNETKWKGSILDNTLSSYQVSRNWKRVSSKTNLSFVEDEVGTLPRVMTSEESIYDGIFALEHSSGLELLTPEQSEALNTVGSDPFVYYYLDVNMASKKATVYYMLKSDEQAVVKENVPFEITRENGYLTLAGLTLSAYANGSAYVESSVYNNSMHTSMYMPIKLTVDELEIPYSLRFSCWSRYSFDIQYQIDYKVEYYNSLKPQE